jgi:hypothetical protein
LPIAALAIQPKMSGPVPLSIPHQAHVKQLPKLSFDNLFLDQSREDIMPTDQVSTGPARELERLRAALNKPSVPNNIPHLAKSLETRFE